MASDEIHGERRHLTVMFCDLVASSSLSERLDPEDLGTVLARYHEMCVAVVARLQGHVAQLLGDGVLAYFSYPEAHDDDAGRAVRAGLQIVAGIDELNPEIERGYGVRLEVRIGIHTGTVVVGELGGAQHHESLALGHTVNLAAKLEKHAKPGTVIVTEETLRLIRGLFVTETLKPVLLEGFTEPVQVCRAVQLSGVRSRLDVAAASGLTPLVGREQSLAQLLDRWDRVLDGQGQVLLIRGEPGIGKSRLVYALRAELSSEQHSWLECRCSPYLGNTALHPFIELIKQGLRMGDEEAPEQQIVRVEMGIAQAGLPSDAIPLVAALLQIPLPERYAPPSLTPEAQRHRTLDVLVNWLLALASLQPLVFVLEDLHLADPSSLELLERLIERVSEAPILMLATYRPSFEPPWEPRPWVTSMSVEALTRRQTAEMVERIPGGDTLMAKIVDEVVRKTDGVPLFVEELTKSVLESARQAESEGARAWGSHPIEIPSTLRDSLAARLDRLGSAKETAQLAAVIGREFSEDLLSAVTDRPPEELDDALNQLRSAELIYRLREPHDGTYVFKHALIHETAYLSLLKSTRRARHERIALALEERFPARIASQPEVMARHCEQGGLIEKAVLYYERAGKLSTDRTANAEAIEHYMRAVDLLHRLPESRARDDHELRLQVLLGSLLEATRGWGSEAAEVLHARTRVLCERTGDTPQLFHAMRGLVTFYTARADLKSAFDLSHALLRLAERDGDDSQLLIAHHHIANVLYFRGDPSGAIEHYERAVALYDREEHGSLKRIYGADLGAFSRSWLAWALWLGGRPDRAVGVSEEAMAFAEQAEHPFSLAYAQLWAAVVHVMRNEPDPARALAKRAIETSEEEEFDFLLRAGRLTCAWADLQPELGAAELDEVMEQVRSDLAAVADMGQATGAPRTLGFFADRYRAVGRLDDALATVDTALSLAEKTEQPNWNAELYRIKAELMLDTNAGEASAQSLLESALKLARQQRALSIELRVCIALARLLQRQGEGAAAHEMLSAVCSRFQEGRDTPDQLEAAALLGQLG